MDSNHRPHAYQACALTRLSYRPRCCPGGPPARSARYVPPGPRCSRGKPALTAFTRINSAETNAGGPDRVRTDDLLDANQALSQLSYGPVVFQLAHCPFLALKDPCQVPWLQDVFKNRIDIAPPDCSSRTAKESVDHSAFIEKCHSLERR